MKKVNDIFSDLDEDILVGKLEKTKLELKKLGKKNTKDIFLKRKDINLLGLKNIKLLKNKTKNFDSIQKNKKLKDINVVQNKNFINKIRYLFIYKRIFTKNFFKKISVVFFSILTFYFTLGIITQGYIRSGYDNIVSISNGTKNIEEMKKEINNSKFDFIISDFLFKPFLIIPNKNIDDIHNIIKGGKSLSILIDDVFNYSSKVIEFTKEKPLENIYFTNILHNSKDSFLSFSDSLNKTLNYYNKIGNLLPGDLEKKFIKSKNDLDFFYGFLTTLNRNFDAFLNIFGHDKEKKYLILFQNNDEIRPTGGFIGSLGIVNIYKGKIKSFEKKDIYALEWEISKIFKETIKSPEGIYSVSEELGLRDSNYEIDFNDSSNQIKFFTDKINMNIDGIIYINQNVVLDLLKITGAINFENIGEEISHENFSQLISTLVEAKTFKVGTLGSPKQILFDFSEKFLQTLKQKAEYGKYAKTIYKHVLTRDIVITSFNSEENSLLWKLGLNGGINYGKTLDYSYPVYTSIGGCKTDRYMERKYLKNVKINEDCSIDTSLKIIQTHLFTQEEEDKLNILLDKYNVTDENIAFIQGRAENKQFLQIVLPKDAIIESKSFYKIKDYKNSKLVQFYTNTRRLEAINHTINYKIQNPICKPYDYSFYKQPGIKEYNLEINLDGEKYKYDNLDKDFYFEKK